MIRRNKGDERLAGWTPDLKAPKHTFWLPVASDRPLKELGREAALHILGRGTPEDRLEKFARVIRDVTAASRAAGSLPTSSRRPTWTTRHGQASSACCAPGAGESTSRKGSGPEPIRWHRRVLLSSASSRPRPRERW